MAETMLDSSALGVGKGREGGYACVAPAGTDPSAYEDMTKTLAELCNASGSVLKSLGYISEDGLTITTDTDTEDHSDWGGSTVDSSLTSYSESVQVGFLESRETVLKTVFGDENVTTNSKGALVVRHNKNFTGAHVFVFDSIVSGTKVKRTIIPAGVINERDDMSYNNSDLVTYTPTIKCNAANVYDGDSIREFIYDTTTGATSSVKSA